MVLPDRLLVGCGAGGGAFSSACSVAGLGGLVEGRAGLVSVVVSPAGGGAVPVAGGGLPAGLRPLLGRSAVSASSCMAAGWQFSQWCISNLGSPAADWPTLTLMVDLVGIFSTISNGPSFVGPNGCVWPRFT